MPVYRVLNLADKKVSYVNSANKAQARSHVTRRTVQVELADPEQMSDDAAKGISVQIERAGDEQ